MAEAAVKQDIIVKNESSDKTPAETEKVNSENLKLWISGFLAVNFLFIKLIITVPFFETASWDLKYFSAVFFTAAGTAAAFYCLSDLFQKAYEEIKAGVVSGSLCKSLALLLIIISVFHSAVSSFEVFCQEFQYQELLFVVFALVISTILDKSYSSLVAKLSGFSLKKEGGSSEELKPGSKIVFKQGDVVACDSEVVSGLAEVKERKFSGSSRVVFPRTGSIVYAGSEVLKGELNCQVHQSFKDSFVNTFSSNLKKQAELPEALQSQYKLINLSFCIGILVLAVAAAVLSLQAGEHIQVALTMAAAILFLTLVPDLLIFYSNGRKLAVNAVFGAGALLKEFDTLKQLKSVKKLIVECDPENLPGEPAVSNFKMLDDRIEKEVFCSLLIALYGASDSDCHNAVVDYLHGQVKDTELNEVKDFTSYSGLGLCGEVKGVELTAGSEAFLVQRGVQMQASELSEEMKAGQVELIALGDELVAVVFYAEPFVVDGREMVAELKKASVTVAIAGGEGTGRIAEVASKAEIAPENVYPEIGSGGYKAVASTSAETALYADYSTIKENSDLLPQLTISVFDELKWNAGKTSLVVFSKNMKVTSRIIRFAKHWYTNQRISTAAILISLAALLTGAFFQIAGPLLVVSVVLVISILMNLSQWLIFRSTRLSSAA